MSETDQMAIPEAAVQDPASFEVLRVWVANEQQHVSLRAEAWEDPACWGIVLSDLMGHIANAYEQTAGLDRGKVINRIREGFDAESSSPTDQPIGRVLDKPRKWRWWWGK